MIRGTNAQLFDFICTEARFFACQKKHDILKKQEITEHTQLHGAQEVGGSNPLTPTK